MIPTRVPKWLVQVVRRHPLSNILSTRQKQCIFKKVKRKTKIIFFGMIIVLVLILGWFLNLHLVSLI